MVVVLINHDSPFRKFLLEMPASEWTQTFLMSENQVYRMKSKLKHGITVELPWGAIASYYLDYLREKSCMDDREILFHFMRLIKDSTFR